MHVQKSRPLTEKQRVQEREKECFRFLHQIPNDRKYVLIGGYAVSAHEFPRFSVDLDIVIPSEELAFFRRLAEAQKFRRRRQTRPKPAQTWKSETYVKHIGVPVGLDLLINAIHSRQTNFAYSFSHLFSHSVVREVRGWSLDARADARIADREMLIALKANAMREADVRDIIALCYEKPSMSKVSSHLLNCPREPLFENLKRLEAYLSETRLDSIRGVFTFNALALARCLRNCKRLLSHLKRTLQEPPNDIEGVQLTRSIKVDRQRRERAIDTADQVRQKTSGSWSVTGEIRRWRQRKVP